MRVAFAAVTAARARSVFEHPGAPARAQHRSLRRPPALLSARAPRRAPALPRAAGRTGRTVEEDPPRRPQVEKLHVVRARERPLHGAPKLALHVGEAADVVPGDGREVNGDPSDERAPLRHQAGRGAPQVGRTGERRSVEARSGLRRGAAAHHFAPGAVEMLLCDFGDFLGKRPESTQLGERARPRAWCKGTGAGTRLTSDPLTSSMDTPSSKAVRAASRQSADRSAPVKLLHSSATCVREDAAVEFNQPTVPNCCLARAATGRHRPPSRLAQIQPWPQPEAPRVDREDVRPVLSGRHPDPDLPVEPPGPPQRRVKGVGTVRGSHHDHVARPPLALAARREAVAARRLALGPVHQHEKLRDEPGLVVAGGAALRRQGVHLRARRRGARSQVSAGKRTQRVGARLRREQAAPRLRTGSSLCPSPPPHRPLRMPP